VTIDGSNHENRWTLRRLLRGHDVGAAMARALLFIKRNRGVHA